MSIGIFGREMDGLGERVGAVLNLHSGGTGNLSAGAEVP